VPEIWGLKEFDAFLLVVDGTPWGGAFNPALASLDLHDVERIEVQRGPAPVLFGATSFVGVIHVIHNAPASSGAKGALALTGGSYGSGGAALAADLPVWHGLSSRLDADFTRSGFRDDRTELEKTHLLWRGGRAWGENNLRFDLAGTWLRQAPPSPSPRGESEATVPPGEEQEALSPEVPLDSNQNPAGAATWSTTASITHARQRAFRGFLLEVSEASPNANGFRENVGVTDLYFDTHLAWTRSSSAHLVAGLDYLLGRGTGQGGDFDYLVDLDGANPPASAALPPAAAIRVVDHRGFFGGYALASFYPAPRWRLEAGVRVNATHESRFTSNQEIGGDLEEGSDDRNVVRPSGSAGVTWTAWKREADALRLFANYKNTFKPAAVDFGLDSPSQILKPETAQSAELGARLNLAAGRVLLTASSFLMDFDNLVIPSNVDGAPVLANAGKERFQGFELSARVKPGADVSVRAAYSYHDARFRDFVAEEEGVVSQLAGNRLEMSPQHLASLGVVYAPAKGLVGTIEGNLVGPRFLDRLNTVEAEGYFTLAASVGYRFGGWDVRAAGRNLTDRRDPVSESELGPDQYYRLPARSLDVRITRTF
jgi:iron complex outermembrane recepter protein